MVASHLPVPFDPQGLVARFVLFAGRDLYWARKAADPDRWSKGMTGLKQKLSPGKAR